MYFLGCQREHLNDCFRVAYATGRVVIYKTKTLGYAHDLTLYYHPISNTCTETFQDKIKDIWSGKCNILLATFNVFNKNLSIVHQD
jgi:hypothetical protein